MAERPRGITLSYRTLVIAASVLAALWLGWSSRDSIGEWFSRPTSSTTAAPPTINVDPPVVNVTPTIELKPGLEMPLFKDDTHQYEIGGKVCRNITLFRNGWLTWNDVETGEWHFKFAGEGKRLMEGGDKNR